MTVEHKLLRQSHRKETARKKLVTASPAGYVPILAATKALLLSVGSSGASISSAVSPGLPARRRTTDRTGGEPGVFPASMGSPEYPTPVGTYTVLSKERSVVMDSRSVGIRVDASDGYLVTVDYAVRFNRRGLFVHVNSLGYENVSHGCVGLSTEEAEWYFNTVNVGDPVIVQENSIEVPRTVSRSRGSAPS